MSSALQRHHAAALKVGSSPLGLCLTFVCCMCLKRGAGMTAKSRSGMHIPQCLTPLCGVQDVPNLLADRADIAISTDIDFGLHQLHVSDTNGSPTNPATSTAGRIMAKLPSPLGHLV